MAKLTVNLIGVMYFHLCKDPDDPKPCVLLPDGTFGDGQIPPHYASIFVEEADYADVVPNIKKWPGPVLERRVTVHDEHGNHVEKMVLEFRITKPNTTITFPDGDSGKVDSHNLEHALISFAGTGFDPKLDGEGCVARLELRGGRLCAYWFNGVTPVQWTMDSGDLPLRITVRWGKDEEAVLVLKRELHSVQPPEIVIANAPDLLADAEKSKGDGSAGLKFGSHGHGHDEAAHHFALFNRINKNPNATLKLPADRTVLPAKHSYFRTLENYAVVNSCTGGCCVPPGGGTP